MSLTKRVQTQNQIEQRILKYYRKNLRDIDFSAPMPDIRKQYQQFINNFVKFNNNELIRSGSAASDVYASMLGVSVIFDTASRFFQQEAENTNSRINNHLGQHGASVLTLIENNFQDRTTPKDQEMAYWLMGLTFKQALRVLDYRERLRQLDESLLNTRSEARENLRRVRRSLKEKKPLTENQVNNMTRNYAKNISRKRSSVLAESESTRIINQGLEIMTAQVVAEGLIQEDELVRIWNTMEDSRVRNSHAAMNGQKRPKGEKFVSGNGNKLEYPGDPFAPASDIMGCRCMLTVEVKKDATNVRS